MVKYTFAALAIVTAANLGVASARAAQPSAFVAHFGATSGGHRGYSERRARSPSDGQPSSSYEGNSRRYSAIPYDPEFNNEGGNGEKIEAAVSSATSLLLDSIPQDDQEEVDALLARKEERRAARMERARKTNYRVTLPIVTSPQRNVADSENASSASLASLVAMGQEIAVANTVGMSLRQVYRGRKLSELALDVDTLRFQSFYGELQGRNFDNGVDLDESTAASDGAPPSSVGSVQVLQTTSLESLPEAFDGVVVSSVARGGLAWKSGIRAGDVLTSTSATMGSKLWPKSTLDGVRSAISSRKVISPSMDFEFKRAGNGEVDEADGLVESVTSFELSLSRPIGINVEGEALRVFSVDRVVQIELSTKHC